MSTVNVAETKAPIPLVNVQADHTVLPQPAPVVSVLVQQRETVVLVQPAEASTAPIEAPTTSVVVQPREAPTVVVFDSVAVVNAPAVNAPANAGVDRRDYLLSLDGSVPPQGEAYLFNGDVPLSVAPVVVPTAATFFGASIKVDAADPTNGYVVEFLVNGTVQETLGLPATTTEARTTAFSYALLAGDDVSARLRRTSGSGASAFSHVTVAFELSGLAGGGGGAPTTSILVLTGEALALGEIVAMDSSGGVFLATATTSADRWRAFGVSDAAYLIATFAEINVIMGYLVNVLFGVAPAASSNGDMVYLSTTAGQATLIAPSASGTVVMELGILTGAEGVTTSPQILWNPRLVAMIP